MAKMITQKRAIWNSRRQGTYIRAVHGPIGQELDRQNAKTAVERAEFIKENPKIARDYALIDETEDHQSNSKYFWMFLAFAAMTALTFYLVHLIMS